jgi:lipopolysaccharide export system permease protein
MRILDRYILKNFLLPFLYCFLGFIAIWLLIDFTSNMGEFLDSKSSMRYVAYFYATQIPQIVVLVMPVALLLALLYSLSRMSRSNEIISMLTAGQSLTRLVVPLLFVGLAAALVSLVMNYSLAAHADATKKAILEKISNGKEKVSVLTCQLFRNRADNRTWFVQILINSLPQNMQSGQLDLIQFQAVEITQQDGKGNIQRNYYAHKASFDPQSKVWTFDDGKTVDFDADGNVSSEQNWPELKIKNWSETPWRILSSNLDAQNLSVPELADYMRINSDFPDVQLAPYRTYYHYRLAYPAGCIVVILIAAPLGIVFSRRGVLAGVASSIFIFFGMMFLDKLFLAFGKHGSIPAFAAAWGTNVIFAGVGLFLLYMRSTNRDLFKRNVKNLLRIFKPA